MQLARNLALVLFLIILSGLGVPNSWAVVDISLNIRYNNPADVSEGGTWTLVATSDTPGSNGIAGLAVFIEDIPAAGTVDPSIMQPGFGSRFEVTDLGNQVEFFYVQFPGPDAVLGVGQIGGPSNQGPDPLQDPNWDNASIIATGILPDGERPFAVTGTANQFDANNDVAGDVVDAFVVRGDSIASQGQGDSLPLGDIDRDFDLDATDFLMTASKYTGARAPNDPTIVGWDDGNFDNDSDIDTADLAFAVSAITADLPGSAGTPELFYDPTTGGVTLLSNGANVTTFHLTSSDQFAPVLDTTALTASTILPSMFVDNTTHTLGWISSSAAPSGNGFGDRPEDASGAYLGDIFPTGLDQSQLDALLAINNWTGPGGAGGAFDLTVASADFDGNGLVDGRDFLELQLGNVPGIPDTIDLLTLWESTYGSSASVAAVPEPTSWLLLTIGSTLALRRRWH